MGIRKAVPDVFSFLKTFSGTALFLFLFRVALVCFSGLFSGCVFLGGALRGYFAFSLFR